MSWSALLLEELLVDIEAFELAFAAEAALPALSVAGGLMVSLGTAVAGGGWWTDRVGAADVGVGLGWTGALLLLCLCSELIC